LPKTERQHPHFYELAKRGAQSRFRELVDELKMLTTSFPDLRDSFDKDELPVRFILKRGATGGPSTPTRPRRKMSTQAREKIRQAQLKRWANLKARAKE